MQFMGNLYVGASISAKEYEIVNKVHNKQVVPNLYLITMSSNTDNMLELIPEWEVLQKGYPKDVLKVVGIALGKKEAMSLVQNIILESIAGTGCVDVRGYLTEKWEGQACR